MKNFDTRVYSINDFLEWSNADQLELSPKFQRRPVWNDNARSYLMDTIVRGKPIPKIFIRQKLSPGTKGSVREVVDGQQRLRTIIGFLHDKFAISKKHNKRYGGRYFSQLSEVDDDIQANILNYEISVDLLVNMPDADILDVFGRLNSYAVVLNAQEKINADHFGPFKTLSDQLGHQFSDFWVRNGVLTEQQVVRMGDVTLAADLLIAMINGIRGKKQMKAYYDAYEKEFDYEGEVLDLQFSRVMSDIQSTFPSTLKKRPLSRAPIFYSLFTVFYHLRFGLPQEVGFRLGDVDWNWPRLRAAFEVIEDDLGAEDKKALEDDHLQFLVDARLATTDAVVRVRRFRFMLARVREAF